MSVRFRSRAVVMAFDGHEAIVLTGDGAFIRVAKSPGMSIGDVIDMQGAVPSPRPWRRALAKRRVAFGAVAASVLCAALAVTGLSTIGFGARAQALVSVDANAEWSLAVDKHMRVVSASAYNAVGQSVLARVRVKGEPLSQAVKLLVGQLAAEGQMPRNDSVVVATTSLDGGTNPDIVRAVASAIQGATEGQGNVYSMALSPDVWKQAVANHVAPAQYASYLLAQDVGVHVHLSDLASANLQTVVAQAHDLHTALEGLNTGNYEEVASIVEAALSQPLNSHSEPRYNG